MFSKGLGIAWRGVGRAGGVVAGFEMREVALDVSGGAGTTGGGEADVRGHWRECKGEYADGVN